MVRFGSPDWYNMVTKASCKHTGEIDQKGKLM